MKSNLALFYQIDANCLCDPGFLVTNLEKKNDQCWVQFTTVFISLRISLAANYFASEAFFVFTQVKFSITIGILYDRQLLVYAKKNEVFRN